MTVPEAGSERVPNLARVQAIIWWIISALMIMGIFLPFLLGGDAAQWGFGIAFLCIVFGITTIVVAVMYTRRAGLVSRMLNNQNLLAHWKYNPLEWRNYAREEHDINKKEKRNLFLLALAIAILVGLILIFILPGGAPVVILTIMGIILMMGCAAFLSVWLRFRQNQRHLGQVYLSPEGVYLNRELHVWRGMGAALETVAFQKSGRSQAVLAITYSVPSRYHRQPVTVRVPVPRGEEASAEKIAGSLLRGLHHKHGGRR